MVSIRFTSFTLLLPSQIKGRKKSGNDLKISTAHLKDRYSQKHDYFNAVLNHDVEALTGDDSSVLFIRKAKLDIRSAFHEYALENKIYQGKSKGPTSLNPDNEFVRRFRQDWRSIYQRIREKENKLVALKDPLSIEVNGRMRRLADLREAAKGVSSRASQWGRPSGKRPLRSTSSLSSYETSSEEEWKSDTLSMASMSSSEEEEAEVQGRRESSRPLVSSVPTGSRRPMTTGWKDPNHQYVSPSKPTWHPVQEEWKSQARVEGESIQSPAFTTKDGTHSDVDPFELTSRRQLWKTPAFLSFPPSVRKPRSGKQAEVTSSIFSYEGLVHTQLGQERPSSMENLESVAPILLKLGGRRP
ncbi:hypothetical protein IE53DRAFT_52799 [Violaceomyces palustris]|uniref:Uncharacterized protein n=1 Tax=Violaceomyces palustris TaxID=1673888 RepID=A0ACD0P025_9BASI|nr:hypothetical protein IE53DRAFT_52799 [Violaceomyces palustris]